MLCNLTKRCKKMHTVLLAVTLMYGWKLIKSLIERWGTRRAEQVPESVQAELSETDKEKIKETQELIHEKFGDSVVESLRNASNKQRVDMIEDFAKELAVAYGLDVEIDIILSNELCGAYQPSNKKLMFNIVTLMNAEADEFEYNARDIIDTIIHELRHAVQHKAVAEPGFWNVDEERRRIWAENINNYISYQVDVRGYAHQPIEADSVTFAGAVMSEVK